MTTEPSEAAVRLTEVCRSIFDDESQWIEADGYPDSLALGIIDSIFSTGSHYTSVVNVITAYRAMRRAEAGDPNSDGVRELLASFDALGGSAGWAEAVNNRKPAHTGDGALLKAEVVYRAALTLASLEDRPIETAADVREAFQRDPELKRIKKAWLRLPSQSSGVTFNYLLILVGLQSVKPDRMVIRFIQEHAGLEDRTVTPKDAASLISHVAGLYPTAARKLDHVIWRYVSGREVYRTADVN
ncbi:hypothetical protein [Paenarthrobacter sp. AMU7]|uniref:Heme peroxidase n=1 Tax=Paenarthrobacter sp. AMU7 TaxID=3162492 RepID=A0AB39YSF7_9MICC